MGQLLAADGCWPAAKMKEDGLTDDDCCPRCGQPGEDMWHRLWTCPANAAMDSQAVQATQHLITRARRELSTYPCFWLRALPPQQWYQLAEFPEPEPRCWLVRAPGDPGDDDNDGHTTDVLHIYLDGSGGKHTEDM